MSDDGRLEHEWCLTEEAVREATAVLTSRPIHQQFVLYLQLRRAAVESRRFDRLPQDNDEIHRWLSVPGGPPGKPHYRPFVNTRQPQPSAFWMNPNLAGSYAQSSLRPDARALFIGGDGAFRLPTYEDGSPDPTPIFDTLLDGHPVPAWAVAAFLFRNRSFSVEPRDARPEVDSLLEAFQNHFEWTTPEGDAVAEQALFDWNAVPAADPVFATLGGKPSGGQSTLKVERIEMGGVVRELDAAALGVGYEEHADRATSAPDAPVIDRDDPALVEVMDVLDQYWGAILSGPPGTSKSHRASAVARALADFEEERFTFTQFHQSYQFDDFIEGYRPKEGPEGGFERRNGVFVDFCERARERPDKLYILVIDELSRGDVGRVFGEALTYIERSRRNQLFTLPSGRKFSVPKNLRIIATMNPLDRGVDEVDAAFERRFGKIATNPDASALRERLDENAMEPALAAAVINWFNAMNTQSETTPTAAVGHTYLWDATDEASLRRTWRYQLSHLVDRAFRLDPALRTRFSNEWEAIFAPAAIAPPDPVETGVEAAVAEESQPR